MTWYARAWFGLVCLTGTWLAWDARDRLHGYSIAVFLATLAFLIFWPLVKFAERADDKYEGVEIDLTQSASREVMARRVESAKAQIAAMTRPKRRFLGHEDHTQGPFSSMWTLCSCGMLLRK